jgi:hypothetical protein
MSNINKHDLVLVCCYGEDSHWWEVEYVSDGDTVTCNNGHGVLFEVNKSDICDINKDDSVLM